MFTGDPTKVKLKAEINPSTATGVTVTWRSGDDTIATVDGSGNVTARKGGSTTIYADGGGQTGSATITVHQHVTGVSVSGGSSVEVGKTVTLSASVSPSDAINKRVTWSVSSGSDKASVNAAGVVTGKKAGTATIRATTQDNTGKYGEYKVTVTAPYVAPPATPPTTSSSPSSNASTLAISNSMTIPNPMTQGTAVSVKGTVTSNYNITNVTAQIKSGSTVKYSAFATPNAKSYNMNGLDSQLSFKYLTAGNYTYVVAATDTSGTTKTLLSTDFSVKAPISSKEIYANLKLYYPLPADNINVSSPVGSRVVNGSSDFHAGLDMSAKQCTELYALDSGTVIKMETRNPYYHPDQHNDQYLPNGDYGGGFGNYVVLELDTVDPITGKKLLVIYAHMNSYDKDDQKTLVKVGETERVEKGALIGYSGTTGHSYGPHLHLQVGKDGTYGAKNNRAALVNPVWFYPNVAWKDGTGRGISYEDFIKVLNAEPK